MQLILKTCICHMAKSAGGEKHCALQFATGPTTPCCILDSEVESVPLTMFPFAHISWYTLPPQPHPGELRLSMPLAL